MIRFLLFIPFLISGVLSYSQDTTIVEEVFDTPEIQPEFPGGLSEMYKFLADNIAYPEIEDWNAVISKTYVQFTIDIDGSIIDVSTIKSCGYLPLDEEAERVISIMPNWEPGKTAGKAEKVKYTIPIGWHPN